MLIDIQSNIFQDIDDAEIINLIKTYKEHNIEYIYATPYFDFDGNNYKKFLKARTKAYEKMVKLLKKSDIDFEVLVGAKIKYTSNLDYYDLALMALENTNYLLIELNEEQFPIDLFSTFSKLNAKGYQIILADVGKYKYLFENYQLIENLLALDVLFMASAQSILNDDEDVIKLLQHNAIVFVTSDGAEFSDEILLDETFTYLKTNYPEVNVETLISNYKNLIYNKWSKNVGEVDYA